MKKMIMKMMSLALAVMLAVSVSGVSLAFAAVPVTSFTLDSGNLTVRQLAGGSVQVVRGSTVLSTVGAGVAITISGPAAVNGVVPPRSIAVTSVNGMVVPIPLVLSGVNAAPVAAPGGSAPALYVGPGAAVNVTSNGASLTGFNAPGLRIDGVVSLGGNINANGVSGGTLNVQSGMSSLGAVASSLNVSGGSATVSGATQPVTVSGGGIFTANGAVGTLTVQGGTANINGGTVAAANVKGGTLKLTGNAKLTALTMSGGTLNAPNANAIPANANITGGNVTLTTKPVATPKTVPSISRNVGTAFASLGLPTTVQAALNTPINGKSTMDLRVSWEQGSYRQNSTGTYTITGTLVPPDPYTGAVTISNNKVTTRVTLTRKSSGGGSNSTADPVYEYWMGVKDTIETSEKNSTRTITVNGDKYNDMPTSVLEELKGTKITLVIERSGKSDIKIYGKNVGSIPSTQIFYRLDDLAKVYKNGGSGSGSSSNSGVTITPTPGDVTPPPATNPPQNNNNNNNNNGYNKPASSASSSSSIASSSSSSSEEESTSSEEEVSSEEESSSSEEEIPAGGIDKDPPEKEKKAFNPIIIVAIVAAGLALAAGIVSYIVIRKRNDENF